jgi:uncharacterized protein YqgQ
MRKVITLFLITLFFINEANANIVDQLTELNNLYKSGALNKNEFSKAKNLLLKSGSIEKAEEDKKKPSQIIEIKASKKNKETKDLSKTFISKEELDYIGQYQEIKEYPAGLFKNSKFSESMLAKKSAQEMYKTFVQHKNLNEKYPENMMKAMAYFEVFFNHKLKEEKKAIEDYKRNYPNIKKISKKAIQSLYSLSNAKESMRKSIGLTSDDKLEDALVGYMHMHNFMSQGTKTQNKLTNEEKRIKKESTRFKSAFGAYKKNLEFKFEKRISQKEFDKDLKKNVKIIKKSLHKMNKINPEKYSIYDDINKIFIKSLDVINNCSENCESKDFSIAIDSIDFSNAILKDVEKKIIKKKI